MGIEQDGGSDQEDIEKNHYGGPESAEGGDYRGHGDQWSVTGGQWLALAKRKSYVRISSPFEKEDSNPP
jgi:hypothetical protein